MISTGWESKASPCPGLTATASRDVERGSRTYLREGDAYPSDMKDAEWAQWLRPEIRFAPDSPLEGSGFELSVPLPQTTPYYERPLHRLGFRVFAHVGTKFSPL
jgi:hypothetical protein